MRDISCCREMKEKCLAEHQNTGIAFLATRYLLTSKTYNQTLYCKLPDPAKKRIVILKVFAVSCSTVDLSWVAKNELMFGSS